ncbi:ankyrin repeat-containing domain protein [Aspergillus keveii]|uniref:Ankyrin repeat-containing domain protein n=1 Tax=Aspergillus keveii TaxID=714993 RepID=A0ABR4FY15_9EURO
MDSTARKATLPIELLLICAQQLSPRDLLPFLQALPRLTSLLPQRIWQSRDTETGQTILHLLALEGLAELLLIALQNTNITLNQRDSKGRTALTLAVINSHEAAVRAILSDIRTAPDTRDQHGRSALSYAALSGQVPMLKILMSREDVSLETRDAWGQTPLQNAAANGHLDAMRVLLSRLEEAVDSKHRDACAKLALYTAAVCDRVEAFLFLLGLLPGIDLDDCYNGARTLLWVVALSGSDGVVRILLDRGVDVNACSSTGQSPLSIAAGRGNERVVKLLLDYGGVDLDSQMDDHAYGWGTALWHAEVNGHEAVARLIRERGGVSKGRLYYRHSGSPVTESSSSDGSDGEGGA